MGSPVYRCYPSDRIRLYEGPVVRSGASGRRPHEPDRVDPVRSKIHNQALRVFLERFHSVHVQRVNPTMSGASKPPAKPASAPRATAGEDVDHDAPKQGARFSPCCLLQAFTYIALGPNVLSSGLALQVPDCRSVLPDRAAASATQAWI